MAQAAYPDYGLIDFEGFFRIYTDIGSIRKSGVFFHSLSIRRYFQSLHQSAPPTVAFTNPAGASIHHVRWTEWVDRPNLSTENGESAMIFKSISNPMRWVSLPAQYGTNPNNSPGNNSKENQEVSGSISFCQLSVLQYSTVNLNKALSNRSPINQITIVPRRVAIVAITTTRHHHG